MTFKAILPMIILYILLPAWVGILWIVPLGIRGRWDCFLHAWVMGFATLLAAAQLILVPLVALSTTLTTALMAWKILVTLLVLASFLAMLLYWRERILRPGEWFFAGGHLNPEPEKGRVSPWTVVFGILAAALIFLQAYIPARYEHRDDDDARFVAEEVSAYVHDTMYQDSPIEASFLYWDAGEVRKDMTSPWEMFVAMGCRIVGLHPAVLSHSYLPFFLILLCYVVYLLIGKLLFRDDMEKTFLFLIFLSVIHLWGYTSTHTLATMLLFRIWQGKAMCASFMLPLFFYTLYRVMQRDYGRGWVVFLYVGSTASCLLSGIGIVTAPLMLFFYGIVDFAYYRDWKKTLAVWMAALPCAAYLGYYLWG